MAEPNQDPGQDSPIAAHSGHVPDDIHLEDIHLSRLKREERRRNLKWMAIIVVLSLIAAGLALLLSDFWADFQAYTPAYEPKDQPRQQYLEQTERGQQKEAP